MENFPGRYNDNMGTYINVSATQAPRTAVRLKENIVFSRERSAISVGAWAVFTRCLKEVAALQE